MKSTKQILVIVLCLALAALALAGCNRDWAADYDDDERIGGSVASSSIKGSSIVTINDTTTFKYNTFNGTKEMWSVNSNGAGAITVDHALEISKGRFKCVIVSPDKEVTVLFDETSVDNKSYDVPEGKSIIKFVGDDAGVELVLQLTAEGDASLKILGDSSRKQNVSLID